ncbi:MAG: hypothetical protein EP347_01005 [Alphaproteobacteria bacterium]|nr:MAG: hypothetical protein EP347_01005 [Alphaproteobacteria bacterium]
MKTLLRYLVSASTCLVLGVPSAQAEITDNQPLFNQGTTLSIQIEAPLNTLFNDQRETGEPVEGKLTVNAPGFGTQTFDIKLETRGKTRRDSKVCKFPPLSVNFKKKEVAGTLFAHQNKLKLVTHCQSKRAAYDTYYLQEYLIYKTYNLITEESFRVRLATIDYTDTEGKQSVSGRYGFFIEDADNLADRLGRERRDVARVPATDYDAAAASRVALFQYFIGNLDWAMLGGPEGEKCCHNLKPMFSANGQAIPVPYDFDYAGLINAKYAVPPASLSVKSVRTRLYRGFCIHNDALPANIQTFKDKKSEIYDLSQNSGLLPDRNVKSIVKYYDAFYEIIDDPNKTERLLLDKCRG